MATVSYKGWPNCYQLSNGIVDLIATTDVGPRIIRFGFVGADNELKEYADQVGKTGGDEWRIYGGHRLWHAPEAIPRSYAPDNSPITVREYKTFVRLIQPVEASTGIQKEIDIRLNPAAAHVQLTHRLRNLNVWPVKLAPWALTVMAQGGKVILPMPPRGTHPQDLAPANTLTLWPYTEMSDPRWTWGNKYIMLRQDPQAKTPQKVGALVKDGWVAYARNGHLLVKTFTYIPDVRYPDFGCTVETFTNADMLEAETLGPLTKLEPQATVEHKENWFLFKDVPMPAADADVDRDVLPKVKSVLRT